MEIMTFRILIKKRIFHFFAKEKQNHFNNVRRKQIVSHYMSFNPHAINISRMTAKASVIKVFVMKWRWSLVNGDICCQLLIFAFLYWNSVRNMYFMMQYISFASTWKSYQVWIEMTKKNKLCCPTFNSSLFCCLLRTVIIEDESVEENEEEESVKETDEKK